MEQHTYRYLQNLMDSDYQVKDGQPDIIGWRVKSEADAYIGEVVDLLYDPQTLSVRYIIIDLEDNGMALNNKKVMIPIGIAHLHTSDDEVVLPNIHAEQFNALPDYKNGKIGPEMEVYVRSVIGSPAALRIEEEVAQFDQEKFYAHQHFDRDSFYQRGGSTDRSRYQSRFRPGEHDIKPWLQPGADHNQGGDRNKEDEDYLDLNRIHGF